MIYHLLACIPFGLPHILFPKFIRILTSLGKEMTHAPYSTPLITLHGTWAFT